MGRASPVNDGQKKGGLINRLKGIRSDITQLSARKLFKALKVRLMISIGNTKKNVTYCRSLLFSVLG